MSATHRLLAVLVAAALAPAVLAGGAVAAPVVPPPGALVADGPITDMARLGDRVYLAGDFGHVGGYTGSGIGLDPASGTLDHAFPQINGQVSVVAGDGAGGWYVGGDFDAVAGVPRANVARILASGALDPVFHPQVDGFVGAIARDGTTLFLGGEFKHVGPAAREGIAAVSGLTGAVLPFDARADGSATELAFLPAGGGQPAVLYAGMGQLLALDPVTGDPLPGFTSNLTGEIFALAVDEDHLYVGGDGLIAVDPRTGARDTAFRPLPAHFDGSSAFTGDVYFLERSGGRLLAAGSFNALGGAAGPVVSLDPVTGAADRAFRPQVKGEVYDVARAGGSIWVGGELTAAGGRPANNLARLDGTTGRREAGGSPYLDGQVNAIAPGASRLFVGGQFSIAGAVARPGFAAVSAAGGVLDPSFAPAHRLPGSRGGTLTAGAGRLFLAPTQYDGYDPYSRRHPFRPSTGRIHTIDPDTGATTLAPGLRRVHNLTGMTVGGSELFLARRLQDARRFPRNVIEVRNARTGTLLRRMRLPLPGYVSRLAAFGSRLYVAGSFRRYRSDGQPAHLAVMSIDPRNAVLHGGFDTHAHGPVYGLSPTAGTLYISGLFDRVGGEPRKGIAAVSAGDGAVVAGFAPHLQADSTTSVQALPHNLFVTDGPFDTSLRTLDTGARDPLAAGGLGPLVNATVATGSGLGVAATITTKVNAQDSGRLSFYTTTSR